MVAFVPVFFVIAGALLWAFPTGRFAELGRIIFACAFLVLMFAAGGHSVRLF
jgi:hypothetical protein